MEGCWGKGYKESWARVARPTQTCAQKIFNCSVVEIPHIAVIMRNSLRCSLFFPRCTFEKYRRFLVYLCSAAGVRQPGSHSTLQVLIYFVNHTCIEAGVASYINAIGDIRNLAACQYHRLYCPTAVATQVDPACSNSCCMMLRHNPEFGQVI